MANNTAIGNRIINVAMLFEYWGGCATLEGLIQVFLGGIETCGGYVRYKPLVIGAVNIVATRSTGKEKQQDCRSQ